MTACCINRASADRVQRGLFTGARFDFKSDWHWYVGSWEHVVPTTTDVFHGRDDAAGALTVLFHAA
eukprot:7370099-Pyramimonas_sp.AAC.1